MTGPLRGGGGAEEEGEGKGREKVRECGGARKVVCPGAALALGGPAKTELISFGSRANLQKIATAHQLLCVDRDIIHSVASVRDLEVTLDSELTLQRHVKKSPVRVFIIFVV